MNTWKRWIACWMVLVLLVVAPAVCVSASDNGGEEKLQELLNIANSVKEEKFTADSWAVLQDAVAVANAALASGDEQQIAEAVSKLAHALGTLTNMKYSDMEAAIAQAQQYMKEHDHDFTRLEKALARAKSTYGCGDQTAVDRATVGILNCLEDYRNGDYEEKTEEEKSFPWGIVIVCVCVCVAAGGAVLVWVVMKKKNSRTRQVDDVPLVDYDIDNDLI